MNIDFNSSGINFPQQMIARLHRKDWFIFIIDCQYPKIHFIFLLSMERDLIFFLLFFKNRILCSSNWLLTLWVAKDMALKLWSLISTSQVLDFRCASPQFGILGSVNLLRQVNRHQNTVRCHTEVTHSLSWACEWRHLSSLWSRERFRRAADICYVIFVMNFPMSYSQWPCDS